MQLQVEELQVTPLPPGPQIEHVMHIVSQLQHVSQQGNLTGVRWGSYQAGGDTVTSVEKLSSEGIMMKQLDRCRYLGPLKTRLQAVQ
mmetsp:Transcript_43150/g.123002  ORF Transcript_43150/g.123002 Transcript_43150/m.123002 type:complete len:87 (-) Transcript_43150:463-723(-)